MMRDTTIQKWKPIIDGYDHLKETVGQYCLRIGIESRKFYYYRKLMLEENREDHCDQEVELIRVEIVESPYPCNTNIKINGIPITYTSGSINDQELSRILRLCRDL